MFGTMGGPPSGGRRRRIEGRLWSKGGARREVGERSSPAAGGESSRVFTEHVRRAERQWQAPTTRLRRARKRSRSEIVSPPATPSSGGMCAARARDLSRKYDAAKSAP